MCLKKALLTGAEYKIAISSSKLGILGSIKERKKKRPKTNAIASLDNKIVQALWCRNPLKSCILSSKQRFSILIIICTAGG